ncbi:MAG TPA: flagellar motor protein MotB [Rhodocyclaceae bacterium]|jgi:chemotaxis protein MotB|nr:flagellar motor protein MotB [Rhodocyclaceae bacterium]HNN42185.1 flagellar motor protein MotB [Nitrospira sp.]HMV22269.1 flagellar motor protein MotB [Rhodocyclaceae bacterium]HNE43461.1 flagellar motor protein MotB [Rhodocyclaceae bacterium]HNL22624.1 flagellar motor protein MotB [Rhodocyclaceae bacterium]
MSDDSTRPIVIKRIKKGGGGHHGGAWKIAYADFVTAMMAFFLLMWLLGSTAQGDLQGIAEFFQNPLKVGLQGGTGSGDSSSILKGGGRDLTRQAGQVKKGEIETKDKRFVQKEATLEFQRRERESLEELKGRIEKAIGENPQLAPFKNQMLLDLTAEGLRIQIIDEQNRPMFDSSSADLKPYTKEILRQIGKALNAVPNRVSLTGHTDAAQFGGGEKGFSNWELSANRANASRRELIVGGMDEAKVLRVVGGASTILFDKNDPLNPVNRRISIVVMNKKTELAILQEEGPEAEIAEIGESPASAVGGTAAKP